MRFTDCIVITGESCKKFDGNKNYISTGSVDEDHIDQSQIESVSYDLKPSRANLMTDDKSILFAKMQGTKKVLLINEDLKENVYSTGFFSVAPKNNILNKECLYHLLGSKTFLNQKDKYCSGATQKAITLDGLNKIEINIPKFEEQNQIAKRLDVIKQILDSYDSILKKYDNLIKARFIEMFGDPVYNPKRWKTKRLLEMGECKNGMNFHYDDNGVEIKCLGVGDFKDLSVINNVELLSTISLNELPSEEYLLKDNDIVFVRSNGNKSLVGRSVVVYPGTNKTTFSGFCIRYRINDNAINVPYLLRVLKADSIRNKMIGRGANIQNLNQQLLSTLSIPIPPIELQNRFADFVKQVDKSKLAVQQSLEKTQQLFDSLMQEYFG